MNPNIRFQNEYSLSTTNLQASPSNTESDNKVVDLQPFLVREDLSPPGFRALDDYLAELEADPKKSSLMAKARRAMVSASAGNSERSLTDLRLGCGLSQNRLAQLASTSQSHIARIERGTENLTISTCRKLCDVLGVDMNTLDKALAKQSENRRMRV